MAATKAKAVPEARQCQDEEDAQFGSVAVKSGSNRWGVMNPTHGGHWSTDDEVKGWKTLG